MQHFSVGKGIEKLRVVSLSLVALALGACGGGGGSSGGGGGGGAPGGSPAAEQVGVLSDSAVAGVIYSASPSGRSGTTSPTGEYEYVAGDKVIFTIAGLALPPVTATGRVTPQTIAEELFPGNTAGAALNLAILFQALDSDGDPSNGIVVDPATALSGSVSIAGLEEDAPQVFATTLQSEALPPGAVVPDPADALAHFYRTELAGNWRLEHLQGPGGSSSPGAGFDIFVSVDGHGHVLWVEYELEGDPATCSVFHDAENPGNGYSAVYAGSMAVDQTDLSVTMASSGRDLMTGCAPGSTDHLADMFDGTIALQGGQLVITRPDGDVAVYFDRLENVRRSPLGSWAEGGSVTGGGAGGPVDFGAQLDTLLLSVFTRDTWVHVVLDRQPGGTDCEYNGVYVAPYSFNENQETGQRDLSVAAPLLNHVWLDPESCLKSLPSGVLWSDIGSTANDSAWVVASEEGAINRVLSTEERGGLFDATVDATALVGSWRMETESDSDVALHILSFQQDGKYVQGVVHKDDGSGDFCGHGVEYGPYQLTGGLLAFDMPELDTMPDQSCGMTDTLVPSEFEVSLLAGDELVLAEGSGWEQLAFHRVKDNGLRGSWGAATMLSLLDDGYYLQMQVVDDDGVVDSTTGLEYGRYSLDDSGALVVTSSIEDTNGTSGLSAGQLRAVGEAGDWLRMENAGGIHCLPRIEAASGTAPVECE